MNHLIFKNYYYIKIRFIIILEMAFIYHLNIIIIKFKLHIIIFEILLF